MLTIDLRTIYLNILVTELIALIFVTILWYQNRKRYAGLGIIVTVFVLHFGSVLLVLLRDLIPDFFSIIVANFLGMLSGFAGLIGYSQFVGYKSKFRLNYYLIVAFILIHSYFTYIKPDLFIRIINLSVYLMTFSLQTSWVLLFRAPAHLRPLTRFTGYAFFAFFLVNLIRIILFFIFIPDTSQNYFDSGSFEKFIPVIFQLALLLIFFQTFLMINRRLILEMKTKGDKLSVIYNSVPYGILISQLEDSLIVDVNAGFEGIFGYNRSALIGKSTSDVQLWQNPELRENLIRDLTMKGMLENVEISLQHKSGRKIECQCTAIQILIDNKPCILTVINDITEKKKAENALKSSRDILKRIVLNLHSEHDKERISLAAQIDNRLSQSLAALRINVGLLKKKLTHTDCEVSDELLQLVDNTYIQTGTTIEESQALMGQIRNEVLYLLGFQEAVAFLTEEIQRKYPISFSFESNVPEIDLEPEIRSTLFALLQDLLKHILQHQMANTLSLKISKTPGNLLLILTGNGHIPDDKLFAEDNHIAEELKEKANLFNGTISFVSQSESFTEICIEVPI
jgi:PAS domain S-box-containing protein